MSPSLALVLVGVTVVALPVTRGVRDVTALVGGVVARWRARRRWSHALDVALTRVARSGDRVR